MIEAFEREVDGCRVLFGAHAASDLGPALDRLGLGRVLVVCTPGRADSVRSLSAHWDPRVVGLYADAREHVPLQNVEAAAAEARRLDADGVVAVGGGSSIGLAKALTLQRPLCHVALPTTYSGSEMTDIYGIRSGDQKRTAHDPRVRPALVLYDASLSASLPLQVARVSLFNALAHAVEAMYGPDTDAALQAAALEAMERVADCLERLRQHGQDRQARRDGLYAGLLAGISLKAGVGLHHKLCHVLGGRFGLPHAQTHAVLLPHVMRYNQPAAPRVFAAMAAALGSQDAGRSVHAMLMESGLPSSLGALGLQVEQLAEVAQEVVGLQIANPREVTVQGVRELLGRALSGDSNY